MKSLLIGMLALGSVSAFAGKCEVSLNGNFPVYWGKLATFQRFDLSLSECQKFGLDKHDEFKNDNFYSGTTAVKYWNNKETYFGKSDIKLIIKN